VGAWAPASAAATSVAWHRTTTPDAFRSHIGQVAVAPDRSDGDDLRRDFYGDRQRLWTHWVAIYANDPAPAFDLDHRDGRRSGQPALPHKPSIHVAEVSGYEREGLLRSHQEIDGTRRDMLLYAATRP
jgi:hypothetical protein